MISVVLLIIAFCAFTSLSLHATSIATNMPKTLVTPMTPVAVPDSLEDLLKEIDEPIDVTDSVATFDDEEQWENAKAKQDSIDFYAPRDTTATKEITQSQIHLFARSYGDSIVLRWAPEDYPSWNYLNVVGYKILRIDEDFNVDTLALAMKPLTLEQFKAKYPESDSIAYMAMGFLYGEMKPRTNVSNKTIQETGTVGQMMQLRSDQQMKFGFSVLISEWRRDLAEDLAMRFVDKNVKKRAKYEYLVHPAELDTTGLFDFRSGYIEEIQNKAFKPAPYNVELSDTINAAYGVLLSWNDSINSSFEIERRVKGEAKWKRVNDNTYLPMFRTEGSSEILYQDKVPGPGIYEYRIFAHDMFGDLTPPSQIHEVKMRDMMPPRGALLKLIEIDRPVEDDPTAQIFATFYWEKDTMEEDFKGFLPLYYHERVTKGEWMALCDSLISPTDTMITIDVTNLSTGLVLIAAYDTARNVTYSMPAQLRVADMKAPEPPIDLQAEVSLEGYITLSWMPVDTLDIAYYEVAFANDTTHTFMVLNKGQLKEPVYVDTVQLDVNERYIYYKVRAVDYGNNIGEYSPYLQVLRPHITPPSAPHLESAWTDSVGIHMKWIGGLDQDMHKHHIYRKLGSEKEWQLISVINSDSLLAVSPTGIMDIVDNPGYRRRSRYEYIVESYNLSGVSVYGLVYSVQYAGSPYVNVPIKLIGGYNKNTKETRIAWEVQQPLPIKGDYYYCIYRKGEGDKRFKFLINAKPSMPAFSDVLLKKDGEKAQYYVTIKWKDGRSSYKSNIVEVERVKAEE